MSQSVPTPVTYPSVSLSDLTVDSGGGTRVQGRAGPGHVGLSPCLSTVPESWGYLRSTIPVEQPSVREPRYPVTSPVTEDYTS